MSKFKKDNQFIKFCLYGFLKNLRFYDAFLLVFLIKNGMSFSEIGMLYATKELAANILEFPSGIVADLYGRKYALVFALSCYIFSYFTFYMSSNYAILLGAMVLMGCGDAFRSGTHKGMIMDYLKMHQWEQHKVAYYGITRSWSQLGSALSALFAGLMVFYSGNYRLVFLLSMLPYALNLFNIITYPGALNHSTKSTQKIPILALLKTVVNTISRKKVIGIINSAALHTAFLKGIKDYIQLIMLQIALMVPIIAATSDEQKSGLVIGILYFIVFLMTSFAARFSNYFLRFMPKNMTLKSLLFGLSLGVLSGFLYTQAIWIVAFIVFLAIYILENIRKPILTGHLSDNVPNEILASVISAQSFYKTIVTSIISIALGIVADQYGVGVSLITISLSFLSISLILNLVNNKRQPGQIE